MLAGTADFRRGEVEDQLLPQERIVTGDFSGDSVEAVFREQSQAARTAEAAIAGRVVGLVLPLRAHRRRQGERFL
jgi:hypothetical protein